MRVYNGKCLIMFQEQVFKSRIKIYSVNKPNYFQPSNELILSFNLARHVFYMSSMCHWENRAIHLYNSCLTVLWPLNKTYIS